MLTFSVIMSLTLKKVAAMMVLVCGGLAAAPVFKLLLESPRRQLLSPLTLKGCQDFIQQRELFNLDNCISTVVPLCRKGVA